MSPPDYLLRVSLLFAAVLALTEKVVAERGYWTASPTEWELLLEVSGLTEHVLPEAAFDNPSAALGFLWVVRTSLETTMTTIGSAR
jgi:hypothetical protein